MVVQNQHDIKIATMHNNITMSQQRHQQHIKVTMKKQRSKLHNKIGNPQNKKYSNSVVEQTRL